MLLFHPNLFKAFLFTTSLEVPMSLKNFFMTCSHPNRRQLAFHLALYGWPKWKIFDNLSSFIRRAYPRHPNLSFIIILESGMNNSFRTAYWLKYGQLAGYPEQSLGNFFGKHLTHLHPLFGAPMPHNHIWPLSSLSSDILTLVCRLIFYLSNFINCE